VSVRAVASRPAPVTVAVKPSIPIRPLASVEPAIKLGPPVKEGSATRLIA
jgi:hypothetical protein